MSGAESFFAGRTLRPELLTGYGFGREGDDLVYRRTLPDTGLLMTVRVGGDGRISAEVSDPATGEPYTLHLTGAAGSFVGAVRSGYEETLADIAARCSEPDVFKAEQSRALTEYAREKYGGELEYLWGQFPGDAVWRRADTQKWYGLLMTLEAGKLGLPSGGTVEIVDFRARREDMEGILARKGYYPGWHMNKRSWYTIVLDGTVPLDEICARMDESYALAK